MDMHSGAINLQEASQGEAKPKSKRRQWEEHIDGWQSSGLTQADYCDRNGIKLSTFRYWRKRLATPDTPVTLVPVGFGTSDGSFACGSGLTLVLADRYKVEVGDNFNSSTLARLVDTLARL